MTDNLNNKLNVDDLSMINGGRGFEISDSDIEKIINMINECGADESLKTDAIEFVKEKSHGSVLKINKYFMDVSKNNPRPWLQILKYVNSLILSF